MAANNTNDDIQYAFEEYQLFYESAERVTDRRLATNRWNYSICTAILAVDAALLSWAASNPNFLAISSIGVIVLSAMAALFSSLWIAQIQDFKMLNNAKFEVLNNMAPCVRFSPSKTDDRVSFLAFEKEWEILKNTKAVQEMHSIKIVALNSSNIEYMIPIAFRVLFMLVIIAAIIIVLRNWDIVTASNAFKLLAPTLTVTPTPTP